MLIAKCTFYSHHVLVILLQTRSVPFPVSSNLAEPGET